MLWWLLILAALSGMHFAPELAEHLALRTGEVQLLIGGALAGVGVSFLISAVDTWLADSRRRF